MSLILDMYYGEGSPDPQKLLEKDITLVIHKAADVYALPGSSGSYEWVYPIHERWDEQNHTDYRFASNFAKFREAGMAATGYMFCRFDRPLGKTKSEIVVRNLTYYQAATAGMVTNIDRPVLDLEQSPSQISAAGLSKMDVALMAKDIVQLYEQNYALPPLLYTYYDWAKNYLLLSPDLIDFFTSRPLWFAYPVSINPDTMLPTTNKPPILPEGWDYTIWQYTWGAIFGGTSFDLSIPKDTTMDFRKWFVPSQETFTPPPMKPPQPPDEDIGAICRFLDTLKEWLCK